MRVLHLGRFYDANFGGLERHVAVLIEALRGKVECDNLVANDAWAAEVLDNLVVANLVAVVPSRLPPQPALEEAQPAVPVETQRAQPDKPPPPPEPVAAVEFRTPMPTPQKLDDDTREIVNAKAIRYLAQARQVAVSRLILIEKDRPETSFPLTKDTATLGRHRNNDIVISDPKVSSFHARIDRSADGHAVLDLKSRNGSYVNGKRVEAQVLANGDEIRVGTARLMYKVDYISNS